MRKRVKKKLCKRPINLRKCPVPNKILVTNFGIVSITTVYTSSKVYTGLVLKSKLIIGHDRLT